MTEDRGAAGSPLDVARQLREAADRLMAGWSASAGAVTAAATGSGPARPALPKLPATMSAEQVQTVLDELTARRAQVQALRDQLTSFDEQLGLLEDGLRPVLEWTRTWADLEKSMESFWRLPGGGATR